MLAMFSSPSVESSLQHQYQHVCQREREAAARNTSLVEDLARLKSKMAILSSRESRSQRLALLKQQYERYVESAYSGWIGAQADLSQPLLDHPPPHTEPRQTRPSGHVTGVQLSTLQPDPLISPPTNPLNESPPTECLSTFEEPLLVISSSNMGPQGSSPLKDPPLFKNTSPFPPTGPLPSIPPSSQPTLSFPSSLSSERSRLSSEPATLEPVLEPNTTQKPKPSTSEPVLGPSPAIPQPVCSPNPLQTSAYSLTHLTSSTLGQVCSPLDSMQVGGLDLSNQLVGGSETSSVMCARVEGEDEKIVSKLSTDSISLDLPDNQDPLPHDALPLDSPPQHPVDPPLASASSDPLQSPQDSRLVEHPLVSATADHGAEEDSEDSSISALTHTSQEITSLSATGNQPSQLVEPSITNLPPQPLSQTGIPQVRGTGNPLQQTSSLIRGAGEGEDISVCSSETSGGSADAAIERELLQVLEGGMVAKKEGEESPIQHPPDEHPSGCGMKGGDVSGESSVSVSEDCPLLPSRNESVGKQLLSSAAANTSLKRRLGLISSSDEESDGELAIDGDGQIRPFAPVDANEEAEFDFLA